MVFKALLFVTLDSILQYFVGRTVNKRDVVTSRCQADLYMKEITLLHAIRLSEFSNLSVTHLSSYVFSKS